jgi:hypothetical protein
MTIPVIWATIGLAIVILGHQKTEKLRESMYQDGCSRFPWMRANAIMRMVDVAIAISIIIFIVVYPLVIIGMLFRKD